MPASPDCILCLSRQALDAARFATSDPTVHEQVLRRALELSLARGFTDNPPLLGLEIHREIRRLTNEPDPYKTVKRQFNDVLLTRLDSLREKIHSSQHPLETAVRIAIAGNTVDFALGTNLTAEMVDVAIEKSLVQPINGNVEDLFEALAKAKKVLYLLDNSGEIVCDRLLIEEILREFPVDLTAVVRGVPVINDVTREDAEYVGLTDCVKVIDNGNDGLGTVLEMCGPEFLEHFHDANLIISKGLANYETLIEYGPDQRPQTTVYLFKTKCHFIGKVSGTQLGDIVIQIQRAS